MFTGASHLSKALDVLGYGELAEASVFIGAFFIMFSMGLGRFWHHRVFPCLIILILWQTQSVRTRMMLISFYLLPYIGFVC